MAAQYERKSQVVELRFFGGLSVEEAAEVLDLPRDRDEGLEVREKLVDARALPPLTSLRRIGSTVQEFRGSTVQVHGFIELQNRRTPEPELLNR